VNCKRKSRLVLWRWPAKRPEAFGFALIFLFLFVSRQKENKRIFSSLWHSV